MRYVAMRFTAKQGRLFADGGEVKHLAVVSNREDLSMAELLRWHRQKAGKIEHAHGVVKNELGAGIVPSQRFGLTVEDLVAAREKILQLASRWKAGGSDSSELRLS